MQVKTRTLRKESTCAEAFELIDQYDVRALPVVDEKGCVEGLISIFQLGEFFIPKPREPRAMRQVHTTVQSIIDSLSAEVINIDNPNELEKLYVRIAAMDIASFGNHHKEIGLPSESSVIVVGDRQDIQKRS
jgi:manganese-dependent inorganic pyrophosphatase